MVQNVDIFPHGRQNAVFHAWSIPWLLMPWRKKEQVRASAPMV